VPFLVMDAVERTKIKFGATAEFLIEEIIIKPPLVVNEIFTSL